MEYQFLIGWSLLFFGLGAASQFVAFRLALKKNDEQWQKKINVERNDLARAELEKRWLAEELLK